jgi:hypothetical protein
MTLRRLATPLLAVLAVAPAAAAADGTFDRDGSYRTANFRTYAQTPELAREFGDRAEAYRRQKALEWLGEEMAPWPDRCPLRVSVNMKQSGGATTFQFGGTAGRPEVVSQEMKIWGERRQLLDSVLPHEVTHTVLAYRFRRAVPRWADEGGSVLSENPDEWFSHDIRCREILNAGRAIPLRVLFTMTEYPPEMIVVYAQGYSVCDFLVNRHDGGRQKFLQFVDIGMRNGSRNWEQAVREVYGYQSVDDLQEQWITSLRTPPKRVDVAKGRRPVPGDRAGASRPTGETVAAGRPEVRASGLPGVPLLDPPVTARGAAPDRDDRRSGKVDATPLVRPSEAPPPIRLLLPPEPPRK